MATEFTHANSMEYILVGGAAATVYGSARLTLDIDSYIGVRRPISPA